MLRYYEQEQLLDFARSLNGYRVYQQSDIERVKVIVIDQLNNAGLTLKLILLKYKKYLTRSTNSKVFNVNKITILD
ncbi:MerR family transcriptional regulator [Gilliamella sp. wkB112]|uniref:MerR family transcriptional regulator n=1 Tax=Gilliamella sp. wkB112 TaxID=3120257 RepID=UPI00080E3888|nr:MerR family transcriptional regulator [Gilliamella apicola]OCG02104.1 hypothetical protein A9G12_10275 [Gilliamella apicola]